MLQALPGQLGPGCYSGSSPGDEVLEKLGSGPKSAHTHGLLTEPSRYQMWPCVLLGPGPEAETEGAAPNLDSREAEAFGTEGGGGR